jgi:hypothetical protein
MGQRGGRVGERSGRAQSLVYCMHLHRIYVASTSHLRRTYVAFTQDFGSR